MHSTKARTSRTAVAFAIALTALVCLAAQGSTAGQAATSAAVGGSDWVSEAEAAIMRSDLVGRMEAALGDEYGGAWFDPAAAQLHVGVTSPPSRRAAEAVAARAGLGALVVETPVVSTWNQLLEAQERWSRRLADLFKGGNVRTAAAPKSNSLEVELDPSVSPSRHAALETAAAAESVDVEVKVAPHPLAPASPTLQCKAFAAKFKAFCDPTIVAGQRIEGDSGGPGCTAGPAIRKKKPADANAATETFILTAGHCIQFDGGNNRKWYAFEKSETKQEIGKSVDYIFNETDIGVIKVEQTTWAKKNIIPVVPNVVANWDPKNEFNPTEVQGESVPAVDMKVCFSGQRSGTSCGKVKATSEEITVKWKEGGEDKEVTLKNMVKVELESGKVGVGDSGAPWFSESTRSTLVGVQSSADLDPKTEEGTVAYFGSMKTVLEKLEKVKNLEYVLLKSDNKQRHAKVKAGKYSATLQGSTTGLQKFFSTEAGSLECKQSTYHAVLTEASSTVTVTPEYKECSASFGVSATISMEGCTYVFHLVRKVTTDEYLATSDISCPSGKSIKIVAGTCKAEVKEQSGREIVDIYNKSGESPKRYLSVRPTVTGLTYTVTQDGFLCPFSGTGEKTGGEYTSGENITVTGQNPSIPSEKIDVEIVDE